VTRPKGNNADLCIGRPAADNSKCPQNPITGYCGLIVILVAAVGLVIFHNQRPEIVETIWPWRKVIIVLAVFLTMFIVEIGALKTYRRNFDFSNPRHLSGDGWHRIFERYLALTVCLTAVGVFLLFWDRVFPGFINFYCLAVPVLVILALPYFWLVERYARKDGPIDEMLLFGSGLKLLCRSLIDHHAIKDAFKNLNSPDIHNLLRALLIKCFFIPFMTVSCIHWWQLWEIDTAEAIRWFGRQTSLHDLGLIVRMIERLIITLLSVTDLTIALIGYLTSMRLLDTQFVSTEPTASGWIAALICYPPFNFLLQTYIWSKVYLWPEAAFAAQPIVSSIAAVLIVLLMIIYVWATISFGMRFSNLSNRGIINHGPYAWVRHPAYASKNVAWWLAILPSLAAAPWLGMALLGVNLIYAARAWTEERHLLKDVHYQEYSKRILWRFIPGLI
jgi:protein-S-isoprenylcysteine O-methyltransferase Ste14